MTPSGLAISWLLVLGTEPSPAAPARLLPRSSIAAVLAHRGELGLDDTQVKQLEERDAALQRQIADVRERLRAAPSRGGASEGRSRDRQAGAGEGASPPSPADAARAGDASVGRGRRGGGMGGHRGGGGGSEHPVQDPAARAAALQAQLDDADTAAWLDAEALLPEPQRDKARAIAERYREALADEREASRARR
jgi:hypothetical protein